MLAGDQSAFADDRGAFEGVAQLTNMPGHPYLSRPSRASRQIPRGGAPRAIGNLLQEGFAPGQNVFPYVL